MRTWLENFAYRVELGAGIFFLSGGITMLIALLTVGYHALRAALANPVEALRYE
jgi:putative ABC transport system permease protein